MQCGLRLKHFFFFLVAVDFRDVVQGKWGGLLESGKVRILQQSFHLPPGVRICDT